MFKKYDIVIVKCSNRKAIITEAHYDNGNSYSLDYLSGIGNHKVAWFDDDELILKVPFSSIWELVNRD